MLRFCLVNIGLLAVYFANSPSQLFWEGEIRQAQGRNWKPKMDLNICILVISRYNICNLNTCILVILRYNISNLNILRIHISYFRGHKITYMITYPPVSPIGFVFLSPCHICLFALNVPQLHIFNDKYSTLLIIAIIVVQGRSSINNNVYFMKLPFRVINTSYWSRKLKMKSLYLMEAIPKLHPSFLLTDSLGGVCLYLIYMFKTKQTPNWVCRVLGLIIPYHSFGCHVPMHYL